MVKMNFQRLHLKDFVISRSLYSIGNFEKLFPHLHGIFFYKFKLIYGVLQILFMSGIVESKYSCYQLPEAVKTIVGVNFVVLWLSSLLTKKRLLSCYYVALTNLQYILCTLGIIVAVGVIKKWFGEIASIGILWRADFV